MDFTISIDYGQAIAKAQQLWNAAEDYRDMIGALRKISTAGMAGSVPIHLDAKLEAIIEQMEKTRSVMLRCGNNIKRVADAIKEADERAAAMSGGFGGGGAGGGGVR